MPRLPTRPAALQEIVAATSFREALVPNVELTKSPLIPLWLRGNPPAGQENRYRILALSFRLLPTISEYLRMVPSPGTHPEATTRNHLTPPVQ